MTARSLARCTTLALLSLGLALPARAGSLDQTSVIVLCWETVEGAPSSSCGLERHLLRVLADEGALLVDNDQAATVRATLSPEKLQSPAALKGVNLFDAEVVIIATVDTAKLGQLGSVQSFGGRFLIRVIDVARGRILATVDGEATARATSALDGPKAASDVFMKSGAEARLRAALQKAKDAPRDVEVWVFDVPSLQEVKLVEAALGRVDGVASFQRVAFQGGIAKLRAQLQPKTAGSGPDDVAAALAADEVGLVVQGATGAMIQLAWDPGAKLKVRALLQTSTGSAVPKWINDSAADVAAGQLMATGFVQVERSSTAAHDVVVDLTTIADKRGRALRITGQLRRPGSSKSLGAQVATANEATWADAQAALVAKLMDGFRSYLAKHPGELSTFQRLKAAPETVELEVTPLTAGGVVRAAELSALLQTGIADVRLGTRLDDVRVRGRLVDRTALGAAVSMAPGEKAARLRLVDEHDAALVARLDDVTRPTPVTLEVQVEGRIGDRLYRRVVHAPLVVHPENTVELDRLASFDAVVDAAAPWGLELLSRTAEARSAPTPEIGNAARICQALAQHGIRPSPSSSWGQQRLDVVAPPLRTLSSGSGDPGALAVVLASALSSAGVDAVLVRAGPALLVGYFPGLPAQAWPLLSSAEQGSLLVDGRRFFPIDPTALRAGLFAATRAGGTALRQAKADVVVGAVLRGRGTAAVRGPALSSSPVQAASAERVLVFGVQAAAAVDAPLATTVLDDVTRALGAIDGLAVISRTDIQTMISAEAERQLLGCDQASCFAELSQAVGARYIVTGSVGRVGERPTIALSVLDTTELRALARQDVPAGVVDVQASVATASRRLGVALVTGLGRPLSADLAWRAHLDELALAKELSPQARVRLLAFAGELDDARALLAHIPDKAARTRATDNLSRLAASTSTKPPYLLAHTLAW